MLGIHRKNRSLVLLRQRRLDALGVRQRVRVDEAFGDALTPVGVVELMPVPVAARAECVAST